MVLKGSTSGAEATITDVRLISDIGADLAGSYFIPNPNVDYPRFETGTKVFTLVNDEDNDQDNVLLLLKKHILHLKLLETVQENIVAVRNARVRAETRIPRKKCLELLEPK